LQCYCKKGYYGNITGPYTSTCSPCPMGNFCSGTSSQPTCNC
jgi:hypothetical protein